MELFIELLAGSVMIGVTVIIQAAGLDFIMKRAGRIETFLKSVVASFWQPALSAIIVIYIFILHVIHIWLWALLYLALDCLPSRVLPVVLNYSTATYTTVGDSAVMLKSGFSMFSGIEAANGLILMGWTTAFIFEFISQIYRREAKGLKD